MNQPSPKVSPRQGALILLQVDRYEIPKSVLDNLIRKIQDACNRYHAGIRDAKALDSSKWEVGNSCRHTIKLQDLFEWYELNSDPAMLAAANGGYCDARR